MALGKIKADTLEHSTAGSLDTSYVVNGSAKAWINFNGTGTVVIRDSFSISNLTDLGTGEYRHTFVSSFANNDYASSGMSRTPSVISGGAPQIPSDADTEMTTSHADGYTVRQSDGANIDMSHNTVIFHGDLA